MDWFKQEDVHPFWFIKRSCKEEDVKNMEIIFDDVTNIVAGSYQALLRAKAKVMPQTDTYHVSYPCLVNTEPILAGQELILNWKPTKPDKDDKGVPRKNAFDQIAQADRKQRTAKTKATGSTVV